MVPQSLKGEFNHPLADGVVFGPGCCAERLEELLERRGIERAYLVTTPSIAASPLLPMVRKAAGNRLAGEFVGSRAQAPKTVVLKAVQDLKESRIDGLISLGGSSVVDVTKGIALILTAGDDLDGYRASAAAAGPGNTPRVRLPHVALPTTLSGSEYSQYVAITDEKKQEKQVFLDEGLTPRWVVLDPLLSTHTPPELWAGTGMKVFADCLEELCSIRANPYTDAVALAALEMVYHGLPQSLADSHDIDLRGRVQFASFMSAANFFNTKLGVVAALRHPLGARGVAHGAASTIVLPHALRWNLPFVIEKLARAARELGINGSSRTSAAAAHRLTDAIEEFTRRLKLPTRLRDVGIAKEELLPIAEHSAHSFALATNPRPARSPADLMEVLERAW